jgi:hypothetical protein
LAVGDSFASEPRLMTKERMRWYCDALETTASLSGEFIVAAPTIHSDPGFAKSQGLPGLIADGMLSTNQVSGLLYRILGLRFLAEGELATKFIRPVYEDEVVQAHAVVTAVTPVRLELDVWVDVVDGPRVTVGQASVPRGGEGS